MAPLRIMFVGTCRMHDPVKVLRDDPRAYVRSTPHRFHTTRQALAFVRHMSGAERYRADMMHLVSDHAAGEIFVGAKPREALLEALEELRGRWDAFDAFVIEISTRREFAAVVDGRDVTVNTFAERDQALHEGAIRAQAALGLSVPPLEIASELATPRAMRADMEAIRAGLNRPVVWVSHMRPVTDDPRLAPAVEARARLAESLRAAAAQMGDGFVDPSETAAAMGRAAFFAKDGADLDHLTPAAAAAMAEVYLRAAQAARAA